MDGFITLVVHVIVQPMVCQCLYSIARKMTTEGIEREEIIMTTIVVTMIGGPTEAAEGADLLIEKVKRTVVECMRGNGIEVKCQLGGVRDLIGGCGH